MPYTDIIQSSTNDGVIYRGNQTSWASARGSASGSVVASNQYYSFSIGAVTGKSRYSVYRSFFQFDTEDIETQVASATLNIKGFSQSSADVIALEATSDISTLNTADFDAIEGWVQGSPDGSGGASNLNNVTKYSDEYSSWTASGFNNITLNATALQHMQNNNNLYVAVIEYDHDLLDITPTGIHRSGAYFANVSNSSNRPNIEFTAANPAVNNSIFFGTSF